ncbi:MAG: DNA gyrase inhibitor YacG [Pseudomonadota bacterium]
MPSRPEPRHGARPPCPICGKLAVVEYRPFCSRRCADVDLGRWLSDGYWVPGEPAPPLDRDG